MRFGVSRFPAVDEDPVGLADLAEIEIERVGELRGQLHQCPIPPDAPVAPVAPFLPGPDADRLPAARVMIGAKAPQRRQVEIELGAGRGRPAEHFQHLGRVAVVEREDALLRVDVARVIVEAQLDALAVQPVHELLWMRDQRTPVVAALPAVVVPGEIQNQRVEGNLTLAEPRNLVLEVLLVVALEVGPPGLRAVGKVFEIEIGDPGAEDPARDHRDRAAELRVFAEHLAVIAVVGEQIPVLAGGLRPRLDPRLLRAPHRRRAVVDERVAAATQEPRLRLRELEVDPGNRVVDRAREIGLPRRQVGLAHVVERIREPTQVQRIPIARMPGVRGAGGIAPPHLEVGRGKGSGPEPIAERHDTARGGEPAVLISRLDPDRRPVSLLHDCGGRIHELCRRRVFHPHERWSEKLEAGISDDDHGRALRLRTGAEPSAEEPDPKPPERVQRSMAGSEHRSPWLSDSLSPRAD